MNAATIDYAAIIDFLAREKLERERLRQEVSRQLPIRPQDAEMESEDRDWRPAHSRHMARLGAFGRRS